MLSCTITTCTLKYMYVISTGSACAGQLQYTVHSSFNLRALYTVLINLMILADVMFM